VGERADRSDDTPPPYYLDPRHDRRRADEFERRLNEPWGSEVIQGEDAELDNAMTAASAVRLAAPNVVPQPDPAFLRRVRETLVAEASGPSRAWEPAPPASAAPLRLPRQGGRRLRGWAGLLVAFASTRRVQLLAVLAALVVGVTAAVVVSANVSGRKSGCGSGGCLASPTAATPSSLAEVPTSTAPPSTVAPSSTTAATAPPATAPPTTRARQTATTGAPATTAVPTTARRQTTTTRQPPTTLPPTTASTTTTTTLPPRP
jgi:hypothetical protein